VPRVEFVAGAKLIKSPQLNNFNTKARGFGLHFSAWVQMLSVLPDSYFIENKGMHQQNEDLL
jgi:hypothetical protein